MIDPEKFYPAGTPELLEIRPKQSWAKDRHLGRGPAYSKIGRRVVYKGKDILSWLDANRIEPASMGEA